MPAHVDHDGVVDALGSEIVVVNDYAWVLDPRMAAFTVAIDGLRVGKAPLGERLRWPVPSGQHTVRVQQWHYYKSRQLTVEVSPGASVVLRANKPTGPAWKAILRLALRPFSSLNLEPDGTAG